MKPLDHFKQHEHVLSKMSDIRTKIAEIDSYAQSKGLEVFWRGQRDHRWGVTSSLVRQISAVTIASDKILNSIEDDILSEAEEWIDDLGEPRFAHPLAKLGYLQHHGVPTRLIDFTRNPWVAVFFAAELADEIDGRLFALLVEKSEVMRTTPTDTPWRKYGTNELKVWDSVASGVSFPRLKVQGGVLAVGRLPSTRPQRWGWDELLDDQRPLLAEEVRSIFSLPFKLGPSDPLPTNAISPMFLTFRLHINKESIRRDVGKFGPGNRICPEDPGIRHKLVYPDADGMCSHSKLLQGLAKGILIR